VGTNGLPADGVTAVAVNLVSVDADRPSYIQALPTNGAQLAGFSNLNIDAAGQTRANFAIIPVGADGSISIYSTANGHIVVDLLGSFRTAPTAAAGGRFVELSRAERILDTRRDAPVAPLLTGQVRRSPMPAGVDPADVAALVVTVTAAGSTGPGWVQVFPSGRPGVIASTSTVNTSTGGAVANTAIVPVTGGGISVTGLFASGGSSDVIIDAIGYITSAAAPVSTGGRYVGVTPTRALDSRIGGTRFVDGQSTTVDATAVPGIDIPVTASGVVWNATIVDVTRPGFLRVWADDARTPATSALNWSVAGEVRASAVISAVGAGRARFLVEDGSANLSTAVADLVIDVFGYFT
jgi:hypothetical protein